MEETKNQLQEGLNIVEGDSAQELMTVMGEIMQTQSGSYGLSGFAMAPRPLTENDPEGVPTYRYALVIMFQPGMPVGKIAVPRTEAKMKFRPN
jgi:hypothetical protein